MQKTTKVHVFFLIVLILGASGGGFFGGPEDGFYLRFSNPALADQADQDVFRSTPYPLPRFVSLNTSEAYIRTGPGQKFPVKWVYKQKHLPLEIILEYDSWRKVKDHDGGIGWIHQSLLSGHRYGLIDVPDKDRNENRAKLYRSPKIDSRVLASVENQSLILIEECLPLWCKVNISGYKGWVYKKIIWGVYENEIFD